MLADAATEGTQESAPKADPPFFISADEFIGTRRVEVSEDVLVALHRVAEAVGRFDCCELARLLHAQGFCDDLSCTRPLVLHFLRLLAVIGIHHQELAPPHTCSQVLEDVWTTTLMHPKLYERICSLFLPSAIIPYTPFTPRLYAEDASAYARLKTKYLYTFGRQPGTLFWPKDAPTNKKRIFGQDSQHQFIQSSKLGDLRLQTPSMLTPAVPETARPETKLLASVVCETNTSAFFAFCLRYRLSSQKVEAETFVLELFRFLILKALLNDVSASSPQLQAPPLVDSGWRTLLLFPQLYLPLCKRLLGRDEVIEREVRGSAESLIAHPAYQRTWKIYVEEFGVEPPVAVWPKSKPDAVPKPLPAKITFFIEDANRKRYGIKADSHVLIRTVLERFAGDLNSLRECV